MTKSISYADAGVSIDNANRAVAKIREYAKSTFNERTLTEIGSFGVRTRKRPDVSDAATSIASGGVSSVCSEVTMMAFGPSACSASIAASASRRVALVRPDRWSNSNWFGVTMSATGTA